MLKREALRLDDGLVLSALAREHTDNGSRLELTHENYKQLADSLTPLTYAARVEILLSFVAKRCGMPGKHTGPFDLGRVAALARLPNDAANVVFGYLNEQGLIKLRERGHSKYELDITPSGWNRIDELQKRAPRGRQAFVAMWFDATMVPVYETGFAPALAACGYSRPFIVSDREHEEGGTNDGYHARIDD